MTEIIIKLFILIILICISYADIKEMRVPPGGVAAIFVSGLFLMLFGREDIKFFFQGWIVLTAFSLAVALLTRGIGGGDVKLFSALGASLGCREALEILALSFFLSGIFVIIIRIFPLRYYKIKVLKTKNEMPFVPFIALSSFLIFTKNLL